MTYLRGATSELKAKLNGSAGLCNCKCPEGRTSAHKSPKFAKIDKITEGYVTQALTDLRDSMFHLDQAAINFVERDWRREVGLSQTTVHPYAKEKKVARCRDGKTQGSQDGQ